MNKLFVFVMFLAIFAAPAFAAPAIQISNHSLNAQFNAGENSSFFVNFISSTDIEAPVFFVLNISRSIPTSIEFDLIDARLNGQLLNVSKRSLGNSIEWTITNNGSHSVIMPKSSNRVEMTIDVHPATETESPVLKFSILTNETYIDIQTIIQKEGKTRYVSSPSTEKIVYKDVKVEVPRVPDEFMQELDAYRDEIEGMNKYVGDLNYQYNNLQSKADEVAEENKRLSAEKVKLSEKVGQVVIITVVLTLLGVGACAYALNLRKPSSIPPVR